MALNLVVGQKATLSAYGVDGNSNSIAPTTPVTWTLSTSSYIFLSGGTSDGTEINVTGIAAGTTTVTVHSGGQTNTLSVVVSASTQQSVSIATGPVVPASASGQVGFSLGLGYQAPLMGSTPF